MVLSASERTLRARLAALELHASRDPLKHTAAARAASPGQLTYWEQQVDPDGLLEPTERVRRAELKRRAHFTRLALKSAQARRSRRAL